MSLRVVFLISFLKLMFGHYCARWQSVVKREVACYSVVLVQNNRLFLVNIAKMLLVNMV